MRPVRAFHLSQSPESRSSRNQSWLRTFACHLWAVSDPGRPFLCAEFQESFKRAPQFFLTFSGAFIVRVTERVAACVRDVQPSKLQRLKADRSRPRKIGLEESKYQSRPLTGREAENGYAINPAAAGAVREHVRRTVQPVFMALKKSRDEVYVRRALSTNSFVVSISGSTAG